MSKKEMWLHHSCWYPLRSGAVYVAGGRHSLELYSMKYILFPASNFHAFTSDLALKILKYWNSDCLGSLWFDN